MSTVRILARAALVAGLMGSVHTARAQTPDPETGSRAETTDEVVLTGITVTARKREENVQTTPTSVSPIRIEELTDSAARELRHTSELTPNLLFDWAGPTPNAARVYLRGVGQDDPLATADPGVGLYVDGVYLARAFGSNFDLLDIERIEVLRGPQGTLYGKNTIGGAINVITRKPTGVWGGSGAVTLGSDDLLRTSASLQFPIFEDRLFARLALQSTYRDGYSRNGYDGSKWDNRRAFTGRLGLRLLPTDSVDLVWTLERSRAREHPIGGDLATVNRCTSVPVNTLCTIGIPTFYPLWAAGAGLDEKPRTGAHNGGADPSFSGTFPEPAYNQLAGSAGRSDNDLDVWGTSLTAEWETSGLLIRSVTGMRSLKTRAAIDVDSTSFSMAEVFDRDEVMQVSEELQLLGKSFDDRLDWVLGAYYLREETDNEGESILAPLVRLSGDPLANLSNRDGTDTETISYAGFAHADFHLNERWTLTGGLRWSYEHKDFERQLAYLLQDQPAQAPVSLDLSDHWSDWSPSLGLSYQLTDDVLLYSVWSRGFRSGGFNGRADNALATQASYNPETVKTLEVGLKSRWWGDRLQLNVSAFRSNYRDMQLTRFTLDPSTGGFVSIVENAGRSRLLGVEAEVRGSPARGLLLSGSIGALDAEYQTFRIANRDFSDRDFKNTPALTFHLAASYSLAFSDWAIATISANYSYRSKVYYNTNNDESIAQNGYGLLNTRIAWVDETDSVEIAFWVRNLLDREYRAFGLDLTESLGFSTRYWAPPRSMGIDATIRF